MVLLCVDPPDVDACAAALSSALKEKDEVAVISFDLGLRNHPAVEKQLSMGRSKCGADGPEHHRPTSG